jgi:hypothetical protein
MALDVLGLMTRFSG